MNQNIDTVFERIKKVMDEARQRMSGELEEWRRESEKKETESLMSLKECKNRWISIREQLEGADYKQVLGMTLGRIGERSREFSVGKAEKEYLNAQPPLEKIIREAEAQYQRALCKMKQECKQNNLLLPKMDSSIVIEAIRSLRVVICPLGFDEDDQQRLENGQGRQLEHSPIIRCYTDPDLPEPGSISLYAKKKQVNQHKDLSVSTVPRANDKVKKSCFLIDILEAQHTITALKTLNSNIVKPSPRHRQKSSSKSPKISAFTPNKSLQPQLASLRTKVVQQFTPIIGQKKMLAQQKEENTFKYGKGFLTYRENLFDLQSTQADNAGR